MSKYNCKICFKEFKQKIDYDRHMKRITPCSIKTEEVLNNSKENEAYNNSNHNACSCCCCFKLFSNKNNRIKHEKTGKCFYQKLLVDEKQEKRIKELEEENKILKLSIAANNNTTINNTTTNTNSNNGNNTTIINNTTNNNYNIIINKYGTEDMSYLSDKQKIRIIYKCFDSIIALIEEKHFNIKHPENSNVFTSNLRSGYSSQYNGKSWISIKNTDIIDTLYDKNSSEVDDIYEELKDNLDKKLKNSYENFLEKKDDDIKNAKNKIKLLLYNKREEVIKIQKLMKS